MSNHSELALFNKLVSSCGETWQSRGYSLACDDGYRVEGDVTEFYLDAVAADANAHIALEFLRQQGSETWNDVDDMASDDGIDLAWSQGEFLGSIALEDHIARL